MRGRPKPMKRPVAAAKQEPPPLPPPAQQLKFAPKEEPGRKKPNPLIQRGRFY